MADAPDETTPRASDAADDESSGGAIQPGPRTWLAHIEEALRMMRLSYNNTLGATS